MRVIPLVLLAIAAACVPPAGIPTRSSIALPKAGHAVLDREYPKWRLARVQPEGECTAQMGTRPAEVTADFNTDGFDDYAMLIQTSAGVRLIVLMTWLDDFHTIELETATGTATRFLGLEKRGTAFTNPQTGAEDFFANDTLVTRSCGPDRIAYFWRGTEFEKVVLPE